MEDRVFLSLSVDSFSSLEDKSEACLDGLKTIDENAKNVDFGERKRGKKEWHGRRQPFVYRHFSS